MKSNVLNSINGIGHERVITVNISNITEWLLKSNFMTIVQFTMGKRHLDTDGRRRGERREVNKLNLLGIATTTTSL